MDQPPPYLEPQPPAEKPRATSVWARMLNVFAVPGEVFEELKATRSAVANWLVPILLYGVVGAVASFLILSQPAVVQQIHEQQAKGFDERVKAGKMTREQADRQLDMMEKFTNSPILRVTGAVGGFVGSFVSVFWWALLLWLVGRFCFKANVEFMKLVEVAGLASVISVLAIVVKLLLVISLSNPLASPSLALLIKNPDPHNKLFAVLSALDFMTFWVLAIRAVGLAKLSAVRFARAAIWVFGVWLVMMGFILGLSSVVQAVFGG